MLVREDGKPVVWNDFNGYCLPLYGIAIVFKKPFVDSLRVRFS